MASVLQAIKDYLIPGSALFLILGLSFGVVLLYFGTRARKLAKIWLTILVVAYWIMSTPIGAKGLESILAHDYSPLETRTDGEDAQAIVILGGGIINLHSKGETISIVVSETAMRAMEGARLYQMLNDPMIIVSGGENPFMGGGTPESELIADLLMDMGVPKGRIILESISQSTREQAQQLSPLLRRYEIDRFILVTSPLHMHRSLAVFRANGMKPIPGPSALPTDIFLDSNQVILPSWVALDASQAAMREFMALAYYWVRGWLLAPE
jgi:uncharacterized SAM-binding protein YcdF (DUF218 family)